MQFCRVFQIQFMKKTIEGFHSYGIYWHCWLKLRICIYVCNFFQKNQIKAFKNKVINKTNKQSWCLFADFNFQLDE